VTRTATRFAVALLVIVVAAAVALPAAAVTEPRDEPGDTRPPVKVYASETLDISSVQLSGEGTVGTDSTTFNAVGGGPSVTVDPTSADFDGVRPGAYYADSDMDIRADLWVVRPQVTQLDIRNSRQTRVTGQSVTPDRLQRLSVEAQYNFADADRLDVSVVGPTGETVASSRITQSGGRTTVDMGDPAPGVYTITVTGSNVEAGTRAATVRVTGDAATATPTATTPSTATPTATAASPTATATPERTATPTAEQTTTPTTTPTAEQTAGDSPGFGVGTALVAALVLTVAVLAWRR